MKNIKVIYKIGIIFLIIFITVLLLAINAGNTSSDIFETLNNFYEHPYTVTNTVKNIKISTLKIHSILDELFVSPKDDVMQKNLLISEYERKVLDDIRLVEKRFLGDKEKVINLRESYNISISVHHDIVDKIILEDYEGARSIADTTGAELKQINSDLIDELLLVAEYIANDYIKQSTNVNKSQTQRIMFFNIATFLILLLSLFILSKNINVPLNRLVKVIKLAEDPKAEIVLDTKRKDEIGLVSLAFTEMIDNVRKLQTAELEHLQENFKILFSNIHLGTTLNSYVRDDNNNVIDYITVETNTSYKQIHNKIQTKNDEIYKSTILDIIKKVKEQNISFSVDIHIKEADIYLQVTAFPLNDDQVIILFDDITEKSKLEIEKRDSELTLRTQQKLESLGTLAGGVAHEINNPINGIMNYGQLIIDTTDKDTQVNEFANEIVSESGRIAVIVKSLLQFSRKESQDYESVEINALLSQTISLIRTIIKHDQIELVIDIDENCMPLRCKVQRIQQVILNLLTNARSTLNEKYTQYNENKIIKVECSQIIIEKRKWFRLTVRDNGNGIADDIIKKIYDPFYSTKNRAEGTGLGLSISYNIVKEHKGKLYCETKVGEYTKFYLELPYEI